MSNSTPRGRLAAFIAIVAFAAVPTATDAAGNRSTTLKATLTGRYLHTTSPGRGTATITFGPTKACWKFTYTGLDTPNVSGIHVVPPPPAGYHKLSVFPFTAHTTEKKGCEALDRWGSLGPSTAKKIVANPTHYYVIIGTDRYPNGAIGGALRAA